MLLLCGLQAAAQTVSGTLSGRVVDITGAVIPNVLVTVKGDTTGLVREAKTNAEGFYIFNFLPIGSYEVKAAFVGFDTVKKSGVKVELNVTTNSEFKLTPAGTSTEVSVTGEVPLIETSGGEVKSTIDEKTIMDRPISGRSFLTLANTLPGFQDNAVSGQNNPTASSGSSINFNGTGTRGSTFQINGVSNDDNSENQNRQGVNLSTIQQAQVLTNNVSAEFGRGYGAIFLVQTKQGTNGYHGDLFWFHQNSYFNALSYYSPAGSTIAPSRRHDVGGTVGGPIWKNKLFFFGSYEGVRSGGFGTNEKDILLPSEIAAGPQNSLPDPLPGKVWPIAACQTTDATGKTVAVHNCSGYMNAADTNFISNFIKAYPNQAPNDPIRGPRAFFTNTKYHYPDNDYTGRIDWNVSDKTTFTSRYQYSHQYRESDVIIQGEQTVQDNSQHNLGITVAHVFSNTQTGEFRLGIGRRTTTVNIGGPLGNDTPIIRMYNNMAATNGVVPGYNGGQSTMGSSGVYPILRYQTDWQFVYNHYWQINPKITFKYGADVRPSQLNDKSDNYTRGYWRISDSAPSESPDGKYHDSWWNLMHGLFGATSRSYASFEHDYGATDLANSIKEANFYFQADMKLRPDFTLNLGIRDEFVPSTKERNHKIDYGYRNTNDIDPRIGFAYSPMTTNSFLSKLTGGPGKSSVRGGFGLFTGRIFQSYFSQNGASIRFNPPNGATPAWDLTTLAVSSHIGDPTNGFVFTPGGMPTTRASFVWVDPNLRPAYSEQWNLSVARELPDQMGITVSYVGNRGIALPFYNTINRSEFPFTAPPASAWIPGDANIKWAGVTFDCIDPNLMNATPIKNPNGNGNQCISLAQPYTTARRPDPRYGANTIISDRSWSYYHALQVAVVKRQTHGLQWQFNYTYGHAIDTGSEATTTNIDITTPITEYGDAKTMRGNSLFDVRHRGSFNYSYQLPFWKSQHVSALDGVSPVLGAALGRVVGGWQINGTFVMATGNPFSITAGYDMNGDGVSNDLPYLTDTKYLGTVVNDGHYQNSGTSNTLSMLQLPQSVFNPNQTTASDQRPYIPGISNTANLGRNQFRTDGTFTDDVALQKNFKVAEGKNMMFRWEVYNMFNHVVFGYPTNTIANNTSGFLRISSQRNSPRYMQFAFRFSF
jgi:hypothetical protein